MTAALRACLIVLGAALGASVASFLTLVLERRAGGASIQGRSHCTCGRALRARENVPVVGYVVARGRASCCGSRIPVRYLAFEVIGALLGAAVVASATALVATSVA